LNILFVCSRNKWRSATAETIYKNCQDHNVKSAGTEPSAVVKVSAKNVLWADIIFAMEKKHRQRLIQKFPNETIEKKIIILDIEDNYKYMDTELIEIIKTSVEPYLLDFSE
jgi:protein-tyrosine phosphatase